MRDTYQAEIGTIDAELASLNTKTDNLIRITMNRQHANQLRQRHDQLTDLMTSTPIGPTEDQLATIINGIDEAITEAEPNTIKRLFDKLFMKCA